MTRRRWFITGALGVLIFLVILCMRPRRDEFEFLKPYVVVDKTTYYRFLAAVRGRPESCGSERRMVVKGLSNAEFTEMIRSHLGWWDDGRRTLDSYFAHREPTKGTRISSNKSDHIRAFWPASEDGYVVSVEHRLSRYEVWLIRLQNLGKDPFVSI